MHWFLDPVTQHYADFTGRASRQQFGMFILTYFLIAIAVGAVSEALDMKVLALVMALGMFLPNLAITVRRLHDFDQTGWWAVLFFVPLLNLILLVVLLLREGDAGPNSFGTPSVATMQAAPATPVSSDAEAAGSSTEPPSQTTA